MLRVVLHSPLLRLPLLILLLGLTACRGLLGPSPWPDELPPRVHYESAWQADLQNARQQAREDYLQWVERFYLGFNLVPGWLDMTDQVLDQVQPVNRPAVAVSLQSLGQRISTEWAKSNEVRRINSRLVNVWRDALEESLRQANTKDYLLQLQRDIDDLLAGELDEDAIYFERYYYDPFD